MAKKRYWMHRYSGMSLYQLVVTYSNERRIIELIKDERTFWIYIYYLGITNSVDFWEALPLLGSDESIGSFCGDMLQDYLKAALKKDSNLKPAVSLYKNSKLPSFYFMIPSILTAKYLVKEVSIRDMALLFNVKPNRIERT